MPFIALDTLLDLRTQTAYLEQRVGLILEDETIHRAMRDVHRRLDGYIELAKTRDPEGLMADETAAHSFDA